MKNLLVLCKIESSNEYKPYMYITSVNKEYFNELKLVDGNVFQKMKMRLLYLIML